jgi:plastocyanin
VARRLLLLVAVLAALVVPACGGTSGALGPPPAGDVVLVARNTQWDKTDIQVPSGRDVVFVVENQDKGIAHNLHIKDIPGEPRTKLEKGPVYQTLKVRFDQPGKYKFVCDLHPNMTGTITAT